MKPIAKTVLFWFVIIPLMGVNPLITFIVIFALIAGGFLWDWLIGADPLERWFENMKDY